MSDSEFEPPDIFLCHSSKDKDFVRKLAQDLHRLCVFAWFDEWVLAPGDSLHESIGKAIESSSYVGVVLSPDTVQSNWCQKELNQALSRETRLKAKIVIPIRYRSVEIPPFLEDKLYIDFSESYARALTLLAAHIHRLDRREIADLLVANDPKDFFHVVLLLSQAGLSFVSSMSSEHWDKLAKLLRQYDIDIGEESFSLIDPKTGKKRIMSN